MRRARPRRRRRRYPRRHRTPLRTATSSRCLRLPRRVPNPPRCRPNPDGTPRRRTSSPEPASTATAAGRPSAFFGGPGRCDPVDYSATIRRDTSTIGADKTAATLASASASAAFPPPLSRDPRRRKGGRPSSTDAASSSTRGPPDRPAAIQVRCSSGSYEACGRQRQDQRPPPSRFSIISVPSSLSRSPPVYETII